MNLSLYIHGDSPLHRLPAGTKLLAMFIAGIVVFVIANPWALLTLLVTVMSLIAIAKLPVSDLVRQFRPMLWFMLAIFAVHGLFSDWLLGLVTVLRFAIVILLALLITFTTRVSEMIEVLEQGLQPFARFGVNPAKVSLMLSMTIRFLPLLLQQLQEIREAQQARGLEHNLIALLVPLLIRTLRLADDLTDAIDARCYDTD